MMEIDEVGEPGNWGSSFRDRFSFGGGRNFTEVEKLENAIWKLLEWADSQRLGSKRSEQKEKAIRVWLQPLVSVTRQNINLFHNDFKKKVGSISQQEVESLLYLENVFRKKRDSRLGGGSDDAERCQQLLTSLSQKAPSAYRKLLVRWVVMEFSKKYPPKPSKPFPRQNHNHSNSGRIPFQNRKKRNFQHVTSNKLNLNKKKPFIVKLPPPQRVQSTPQKEYSMQSKINLSDLKVSKQLVGNVKENKKFPVMGWIFPCVLCFQPTSNTLREQWDFHSAAQIYVCKKCIQLHDHAIPSDIKNGTRSNTRVISV